MLLRKTISKECKKCAMLQKKWKQMMNLFTMNSQNKDITTFQFNENLYQLDERHEIKYLLSILKQYQTSAHRIPILINKIETIAFKKMENYRPNNNRIFTMLEELQQLVNPLLTVCKEINELPIIKLYQSTKKSENGNKYNNLSILDYLAIIKNNLKGNTQFMYYQFAFDIGKKLKILEKEDEFNYESMVKERKIYLARIQQMQNLLKKYQNSQANNYLKENSIYNQNQSEKSERSLSTKNEQILNTKTKPFALKGQSFSYQQYTYKPATQRSRNITLKQQNQKIQAQKKQLNLKKEQIYQQYEQKLKTLKFSKQKQAGQLLKDLNLQKQKNKKQRWKVQNLQNQNKNLLEALNEAEQSLMIKTNQLQNKSAILQEQFNKAMTSLIQSDQILIMRQTQNTELQRMNQQLLDKQAALQNQVINLHQIIQKMKFYVGECKSKIQRTEEEIDKLSNQLRVISNISKQEQIESSIMQRHIMNQQQYEISIFSTEGKCLNCDVLQQKMAKIQQTQRQKYQKYQVQLTKEFQTRIKRLQNEKNSLMNTNNDLQNDKIKQMHQIMKLKRTNGPN